MSQLNRLRALQVCVASHDDTSINLRAMQERGLHTLQQFANVIDGVSNIQPQVGRNLIVAASRGVQFPGDIAQAFDQLAFDVHVDVFEFRFELELTRFDF